MSEQQNHKTENEANNERKLIGLGGWLSFVQAGMILVMFATLSVFMINLQEGSLIKLAINLLMLTLIITAVIQFYSYKMIFRVLLLAYAAVAILYYYTVSEYAILSAREHWISSIGFALAIVPVICLFFSNQVTNTFCEQERKRIKEIKKENPPLGINGWLVLVQFSMVKIFVLPLHEALEIASDKADFSIWTIVSCLASVIIVFCAIQFFKRRIAFVTLYIFAAILFNLKYLVISQISIFSFSEGFAFVINAAFYGLIIYGLHKSDRVKNTFK